MESVKPIQIDQISNVAISVKWSDEHESIFFADHLRKNCPCADCESRKAKIGDNAFPFLKDLEIITWKLMGRYAVSFTFSDHHSTGIYTYDYLRSLCQCNQCSGNVIHITGPFR